MALTTIDDRGLKTPIDLLDNEKIRFGTGNDLEISHTGSYSLIFDSNNQSDLYIQTNERDITLKVSTTETAIVCNPNSAVELYFDNSKKFQTTSVGCGVTGNLTFADNGKAIFGAGDDLEIFHNGTNAEIKNITGQLLLDGQAQLNLRSAGNILAEVNDSETAFKAIADGAVELYHNNIKKLETTSDGINVDGFVYATRLDLDDNEKILLGTGDDLQIYHSGSHAWIKNTTGYTHIAAAYVELKNAADNETTLKATQNAAVELYYDNVKKFETSSSGADFSVGTGEVDINSTGSGDQHSLRLLNSNASAGNKIGIYFGPANNVAGASIQGIAESDFTTTANRDGGLIFTTRQDGNWNERVRIDSSGNLGINESASNMANGKLTVKLDTNKHIAFNPAQGEVGSVPALVAFQDNGSLQDIGFRGVSVRFAAGSAERGRWTDSGLTFNGDTAGANALNDYEEGTGTMQLDGSGGSSPSTQADSNSCVYTKIGRQVTVRVHWDSKDLSGIGGNIALRNLPFTVANTGSHFVIDVSMIYNVAWSGDEKHCFYTTANTTSAFGLSSRDGNSWVNWASSDWDNAAITLYLTFTYFTD